jgi:hypothetical protein
LTKTVFINPDLLLIFLKLGLVYEIPFAILALPFLPWRSKPARWCRAGNSVETEVNTPVDPPEQARALTPRQSQGVLFDRPPDMGRPRFSLRYHAH